LVLEGQVVSEKSAQNSGTENCNPETEAISTEILTSVLNNFVHRLHEVRDLLPHHTENILV
jgi:hypothetical protein